MENGKWQLETGTSLFCCPERATRSGRSPLTSLQLFAGSIVFIEGTPSRSAWTLEGQTGCHRFVGYGIYSRGLNEDGGTMMEDREATLETGVGSGDSRRDWLQVLQEVRNWVRDVFFAALTAILIVVFVVQPVKVEGTSMQPWLSDQERIFVNKFVYHFSHIERGDIVVFWYPKDPTKSFIKRVIGLPGEEIEIRSGVVLVDGKSLDEPYVTPEFFDYASYSPQVVPAGSYFVLGDHRNSSNDSRHWGCVAAENVFGKAIFRYWPVSKLGLLN
jgi:signal peptidase I